MPREAPGRAQNEGIDIARAHHSHRTDELLGARKIDHRRKPPLARKLPRQHLQISDELRLVGQPAAGVDAPLPRMQNGLRHHHRGQIGEALGLRCGNRSRVVIEHAERAKAMAIARLQRRRSIEAEAGAGQFAFCVGALLQVGDRDDALTGEVGGERERVEGDAVQAKPDGRAEPVLLPIEDGERGEGNTEQRAGRAGDAVEPRPERAVAQIRRLPRALAGPLRSGGASGLRVVSTPGTQYTSGGPRGCRSFGRSRAAAIGNKRLRR